MIRLPSLLAGSVLAGSVLAGTVHAQTVPIQSGDHPGFTRLVLPIGSDRDWELVEASPETWALSLSPAVAGFDTSRVFDLIRRDRLAGLSAEGGLTLELACPCDVNGFRYDGRFLVIDIADPDPAAGGDPDGSDATAAADAISIGRAQAAAALPDLASLLLRPTDLPTIRQPDTPAAASAPESDAPNPRLAEAADIMAEQLARAAASGLLDAALGQPMTLGDPQRAAPHGGSTEPDAAPEPRDADGPDMANAPPERLPVRAETALDIPFQPGLPLGAPPPAGSCRGAPLDARDWAEGYGLGQGLGTLRSALYDERDALVPDGAIALARYYLYHGFGAEAAYWLTQLSDPPLDLLRIAALVDGADTAAFPDVDAPGDCAPSELLWRYRAGSVAVDLGSDDVAAIQRAFAELPAILRDQVGPALARRLAADRHERAARNIRDALYRGGRIATAELRLLDLDLGVAPDPSADLTRSALAETLRDDGGDPAAVMASALAFDRDLGARPEAARLTAAEALLRETGTGAETDALWQEVLLGRAAIGQIDTALTMLGDSARSDDARAAALTELIAERVAVGDTAALLILAYTYGRDWRPTGSAAGRAQVQAVAALRAEGLFEAAQILRDVRRPLILPAPDPDPETAAYRAADAWADRDWPRLAETGTGPHAEIAARLASRPSEAVPSPPGAPDLAALSETVRDSRAMRAQIAELLTRPTPP